uniref:Uncharacterized protein n=1 Tax=Noccaea caerulescens TaxID=107243 RepID=A0A1J3HUZ6_NOCCA
MVDDLSRVFRRVFFAFILYVVFVCSIVITLGTGLNSFGIIIIWRGYLLRAEMGDIRIFCLEIFLLAFLSHSI